MRISVKIGLSYLVVVILSVAMSSLLFWSAVRRSTEERVSDASAQALAAIRINFELTVENANNYSKSILADSNLQGLLRQGSIYSNLAQQSQVGTYLYSLIQAVPIVDSVYVFDTGGNVYSVGKKQPPALKIEEIEQAPWYGQMESLGGANMLCLNAGGILEEKPEYGNYVSLVRQVRDLDNMEPLGTLLLNIPESAIMESYQDALNDPGTRILILDDKNQPLVAQQDDSSYQQAVQMVLEKAGDETQEGNVNGEGHLLWFNGAREQMVSYLQDERYGFTFISIAPYLSVVNKDTPTLVMTLALLTINGLIFFVSSIIISRSVTTPIRQMVNAMGQSGKREFKKLEEPVETAEFQQLFDGYNAMLERIERLVQDVIAEQTAYRKAELHALQVQIKPHFLYNTLDTILALNMLGETEKACQLVEALGGYYRTSVSKGSEVISLKEEIEMVENYMVIQNIRYKDLCEMEYEIDPACLDQPVLKMILQPLVENALYHGIRPLCRPGKIWLTVQAQGECTQVIIKDNGMGMSQEKLDGLLHPGGNEQSGSFGLWGTLERVRIFYNADKHYEIESKPGEGTTIRLFLPKEVD